MKKIQLKVGDEVKHCDFGECTIVFIGKTMIMLEDDVHENICVDDIDVDDTLSVGVEVKFQK